MDIRNHIKIEQQIKLYAESLQLKIDEDEKAHKLAIEKLRSDDKNAI